MQPPATALYAALLGLLYVRLSLRVIRHRRSSKIAIGTTGDVHLERAARVHGNFAEYVPLGLVLIYSVEATGYPWWAIHPFGLLLLAGRLLHAHGVSQEREDFSYRVAGMVCTFLTLLSTAGLVLFAFARTAFRAVIM